MTFKEQYNKKIQFTKELAKRTDIQVIAELKFEEKEMDLIGKLKNTHA